MTKRYLGDGVYVEIGDTGDLVLTTEDGVSVTNRIVFDEVTMAEFEQYVEQWETEQMSAFREGAVGGDGD